MEQREEVEKEFAIERKNDEKAKVDRGKKLKELKN